MESTEMRAKRIREILPEAFDIYRLHAMRFIAVLAVALLPIGLGTAVVAVTSIDPNIENVVRSAPQMLDGTFTVDDASVHATAIPGVQEAPEADGAVPFAARIVLDLATLAV